jgi:hypothetical protein
MTMTFIFSGKWIGAGWATKLNDLIARDRADVDDFLPGALAPMKGGADVFALPFVAESTLMVYRKDLFEKAGVKAPGTFDELLATAPKLQSGDVRAYMGRGTNGFHWIWPNYLLAYGGRFFADPPRDMTPMLATPEAIKSADIMCKLYREYSLPGVASFAEPQSSGGMMEGKAAVYIDALAWVGRLAAGRAGRPLPPAGRARDPDSGRRQAEGRRVGIRQVGDGPRGDASDCRDDHVSGRHPGECARQPRLQAEIQLGWRRHRCASRRGAATGRHRLHGIPDGAGVPPGR